MKYFTLSVIILTSLTIVLFARTRRISGEWVRSGDHWQMNVSCAQAWKCRCSSSMYSEDCSYRRDSEVTMGTCYSRGTIDKCEKCTASRPKKTCYCTIRCPDSEDDDGEVRHN